MKENITKDRINAYFSFANYLNDNFEYYDNTEVVGDVYGHKQRKGIFSKEDIYMEWLRNHSQYIKNKHYKKKFNVEIELTDQEIDLLKTIDWKSKQPREPYSKTDEVFSLSNKGVIEYISNDYEGDYGLSLTKVGISILSLIN